METDICVEIEGEDRNEILKHLHLKHIPMKSVKHPEEDIPLLLDVFPDGLEDFRAIGDKTVNVLTGEYLEDDEVAKVTQDYGYPNLDAWYKDLFGSEYKLGRISNKGTGITEVRMWSKELPEQLFEKLSVLCKKSVLRIGWTNTVKVCWGRQQYRDGYREETDICTSFYRDDMLDADPTDPMAVLTPVCRRHVETFNLNYF